MNSYGMRSMLVGALLCAAVVALAASAAPAASKVDMHGFILNRLYFAPGAAHFEVERIGLQAAVPLSDDAKALVEWYYHYWSTVGGMATGGQFWLESAYVDYNDKCGGRLRVGRGRNFAFGITPTGGMRKTTEYGLVSEAMTMDRITGLQYHMDAKNGWAWDAALYNGYSLGSRPTQDMHTSWFSANTHLCDRENVGKDVLEVSARVAKQMSPTLGIGVSARGGKLSPGSDGVGFLQTNFNPAWTSRTKMRYGLDAIYRRSPWIANAEFYLAKTGDLDHSTYALLVGHEPKNPNAAKAYVRYGVSDLDLTAAEVTSTSNQLTFDQAQWMFSVVQPIRPGLWVELAYIANDQDPLVAGVTVPENDIGFVELAAMY